MGKYTKHVVNSKQNIYTQLCVCPSVNGRSCVCVRACVRVNACVCVLASCVKHGWSHSRIGEGDSGIQGKSKANRAIMGRRWEKNDVKCGCLASGNTIGKSLRDPTEGIRGQIKGVNCSKHVNSNLSMLMTLEPTELVRWTRLLVSVSRTRTSRPIFFSPQHPSDKTHRFLYDMWRSSTTHPRHVWVNLSRYSLTAAPVVLMNGIMKPDITIAFPLEKNDCVVCLGAPE